MMIVARHTRSLGVESLGHSAASLALLIGRDTSNSSPQFGHLKSYSGIDVPPGSVGENFTTSGFDIDQLKPGGRMVIPVGGPSEVQQLLVVEKQADGRTTTKRTLPVRFVPLTGDRGAKR